MKMALKDGQIMIKEADNMQFQIIKSWNKLRWVKAEQMLQGPADGELLNKLAGLVRLPAVIEAERQRLNSIQDAVDKVRMCEDPVPIIEPPVKMKMFKHQVRGYLMALITFGLINPERVEEVMDGKQGLSEDH